MTLPIIVRKAIPSDLDALIGLLKLLFEIETDFSFDPEKQRCGLDMILREENRSCLMVAVRNQEIIGMCSAQLLISTAEGGFKALIEDLVITPNHRGQGIGKKLLEAIEQWSVNAGAKRLDLLADRRNAPALQFYTKMDWQRTELIALQKKVPFLRRCEPR